eukprot:TRINITY_DN14926_c0_g1_i1.p1 TRINITY_DN14926_c0_g1~~TRINITY_DN14926_c0_g1_i1.p1  ORF type:complete len:418 (+),score=78.82 TRINITY_DN14926_c0_g1_i1:128-1381(+)
MAATPTLTPTPTPNDVKDEIKRFLVRYKEETKDEAVWSTRGAVQGVFRRLWENGVGCEMKRRPEEAGRITKRWFVGKVKVCRGDGLWGFDMMKSSTDDSHYTSRKNQLLRLVHMVLFSEVCSTYFSQGPEIFPDPSTLQETLKQSLEGAPPTPPPDPELTEDFSLFDPDSITSSLNLPLWTKPCINTSQDSVLTTPTSAKRKWECVEQTDLPPRQETSSFSYVNPPSTPKILSWPLKRLLHKDPVSDGVIQDVAMPLRMAAVGIDFDPNERVVDTRVVGSSVDEEAKVYPFERCLNDTVVAVFGLVLPKTLKTIFHELELNTANSTFLHPMLSLRSQISNEDQVWPGTEPLINMTTPAPATPNSCPFSQPRKKRRHNTPSATPAKNCLELELERIMDRKSRASTGSAARLSVTRLGA